MTDPLCQCDHPKLDHKMSLFGPVCEGNANHDGSDYRCACGGFVAMKADRKSAWVEEE